VRHARVIVRFAIRNKSKICVKVLQVELRADDDIAWLLSEARQNPLHELFTESFAAMLLCNHQPAKRCGRGLC
jgi:hypothetical protein